MEDNQAAQSSERMDWAGAVKPYPVTYIIPYYNGSATIERALKSLLEQHVVPSEIIVVDDGSRADHSEYLRNLEALYDFKILSKENGGQGSARNEGGRCASNPYVCFLDQDDYVLPWHCEVLYKAMSEDKDSLVAVCYGDVTEADLDGNVFRHTMIKEHAKHPKNSIIDFLGQDAFILPTASIIKRSDFLEVGGFDTQFTGYEDDDLFLRIFRAGKYLKFVDRQVYVWCIHSSSTSYSLRMSRSRIRYVKKLVAMFPDDLFANRRYIRDIIFPRFYGLIALDHVKARLLRDPNKREYAQIHREMLEVVSSHLKAYRRAKIFGYYTFIEKCPLYILRFVVSIRLKREFNEKQMATGETLPEVMLSKADKLSP